MVTIPRMSDRFHLTIGKVKFVMSPLNVHQKKSLSENVQVVNGEMMPDLFKSQCLYLKYSLKEVKGIKDYNGKDYQLEFDENDHLTDDCVSEILMLPQKEDFMNAAWQILNEIPEKILDGKTGKPMKGAKLEIVSPN